MAKQSGYRYIEPSAVAKLGKFNLIAKSVVEGFVTGLHRSPYHGFSVEFSDHREYVPGDNPRDLDWIALGRTDRLYIKRYEEETNLKAYILLDTSASMGYKFKGLTKLEYSSYLAASLAYLMIRQSDSVGLITFDTEIRTFIPPHSTPSHLNLLLHKLEEIAPSEKTHIGQAFHELAEHVKRRGLIIVISDLVDLFVNNSRVVQGLSHFRHKKHEVIVFHVFDKAELDFPFQRLSDFVDMETRERLQVDPKYVRDEYLNLIEEFKKEFQNECTLKNIDYVPTDTSTPYDFMLTKYLSRRKRIR